MDVSVENTGALERKMTVRLPSNDIEREIDARLNKVGRTARMKGFRPGKIPPKVVRQRFGGQVRQEVLSDVINQSFSRAVAQEQLQPASGPNIEAAPADSADHFSYIATFEVYPEIELKGLDGLTIDAPLVTIDDSDVDAMVERLREQRAQYNVVERKAREGDRVVIAFKGSIDGELFEGGSGEDVPVDIGAGQFLPDLEKALKGTSAGEHKTAKVKFPKEYPAEQLAGKKALFELDVDRVEEKSLPEIDDEFLAAFEIEEGGLAALREKIRNNMERELGERVRADLKQKALDALLAANSIDVPRSLIHHECHDLQKEAMRRMGVTEADQAPALSVFEEAARRRVTVGLLVQELIRSQDLKVEPASVEAKLAEIAAPFQDPDEVMRIYRGNRDLMGQLESSVLEDNVIDWLLERAHRIETKQAFAEFMGL
jgi:trigger factor